jgi:hypothetical protein
VDLNQATSKLHSGLNYSTLFFLTDSLLFCCVQVFILNLRVIDDKHRSQK